MLTTTCTKFPGRVVQSTSFQRRCRDTETCSSAWSGSAFKGLPIRKCPGVSIVPSSVGWLSMDTKGRLLTTASASVSTVQNSKVKECGERTLVSVDFRDQTPASHNPPKWGAQAGEKCHSKRSAWTVLVTSSWKS